MPHLGGRNDRDQASDVLTSFHFSVVGREINERIEAVASLVPQDRKLSLICECGDADCEAQVQITPQQYRQVRTNLQRFIVAPGHESPESERVLKATGQWIVVEKLRRYSEVGSASDVTQAQRGTTA